MAWVAVTGTLGGLPLLLGLATFCSLSATDLVYAIQDYSFDQIEGLYSVPSRFGIAKARHLAQLLHLLSLLCLTGLGWWAGLGPLYYVGLPLLSALLVRFHWLLRRAVGDLTPLFFRYNVLFSSLTFLSVLGGLLWRVS